MYSEYMRRQAKEAVMPTQYAHTYGGKAVDLGPFTFENFVEWLTFLKAGAMTTAPRVTIQDLVNAPTNVKIFDFTTSDNREVLVYKINDTEVRLTVINK
jgi:hypothetical protein